MREARASKATACKAGAMQEQDKEEAFLTSRLIAELLLARFTVKTNVITDGLTKPPTH